MTGIADAAWGYGRLPYCGPPPDPASLATRWNLDPALICALLAVAAAYPLLKSNVPERRSATRWRGAGFMAGWLCGTAALISPLCPLSVSLFAARVGQHMVLETIAAPLIAAGLPAPPLSHRNRAIWASVAFAALLWFWHSPSPYDATFSNDVVYWLMHLSTFGAALWFWREMLHAIRRRLAVFLAAAMATTVQMGLLGALLTFAGRPLFRAHDLTTAAWGLSPLEDQQLGGVIMWVPAGAIFLVSIIWAVAATLQRAEHRPLTTVRA